jgi:hypothetical protein
MLSMYASMMRPISFPKTRRIILEPEGHRLIEIRAKRCDERGCELVRHTHRDLVVLGVRIEKTEGLAPCR